MVDLPRTRTRRKSSVGWMGGDREEEEEGEEALVGHGTDHVKEPRRSSRESKMETVSEESDSGE